MVGGRARLIMLLSWLPLLLAATWVPGAPAAPAFAVALTSPTVEFGKPVWLKLHAQGLRPSLDTLDLSALDRAFAIATPQDVQQDSQAGTQDWRLRLYPRHSGTLSVPALNFGGSNSSPLTLTVQPAVDRPGGDPIEVSSRVSATHVWLGQAIQLDMRIDSDSPFVWLQTGSGDHPELQVIAQPQTQTQWLEHGRQRTSYRVAWVIYPLSAGRLELQLPAVRYQLDGQVTHRFYPPRLLLDVRPLPEFVPPTMPVGLVRVAVTPAHDWWLSPHQLAFLTLRIGSDGPPGQRPSAILEQLRSNGAFNFYPPRELPSAKDQEHDGMHWHSYRIPFAPRHMGWLELPTLRIQYFDPASGKLVTLDRPLGRVLSVGRWLVYPVAPLLLWLLYRLGALLYRRAAHGYRVYRAYRRALFCLQQADTPQALKAGLMEIATGEGWQANQTLAVWLGHWRARYPRLSHLDRDVERLQGWLYGGQAASLAEIRASLEAVCYRRMPVLRLAWLRMQR